MLLQALASLRWSSAREALAFIIGISNDTHEKRKKIKYLLAKSFVAES
jgi:hypothetical protein